MTEIGDEAYPTAARALIENTARAHGCVAAVEVTEGEPATVNDPPSPRLRVRSCPRPAWGSPRPCARAGPTTPASTGGWRRRS